MVKKITAFCGSCSYPVHVEIQPDANGNEFATAYQCPRCQKRMRETLEALIQWREQGGDAPEMLEDIVGWAREAVQP